MKGIAEEFIWLIVGIILAIVAIVLIVLFYDSEVFKSILDGLGDALRSIIPGGGGDGW